MITLSQQEMQKFGLWLTQEADSIDGTATQMQTLKVPEALFRKFRAEAAAHRIVASKLLATEVDRISK